jgi:hypothetical protein
MCGDPDYHHCDIDGGNEKDRCPFDLPHCFAVLGYKGYAVDDDLHEKLDFKDPEKQNEEKNRHAVVLY